MTEYCAIGWAEGHHDIMLIARRRISETVMEVMELTAIIGSLRAVVRFVSPARHDRGSHLHGAAAGMVTLPVTMMSQLAFQDGNLMAQDQDLGVLMTIAYRKTPRDRERVRHRRVGQSQQHKHASCHGYRFAAAASVLCQGGEAGTWRSGVMPLT